MIASLSTRVLPGRMMILYSERYLLPSLVTDVRSSVAGLLCSQWFHRNSFIFDMFARFCSYRITLSALTARVLASSAPRFSHDANVATNTIKTQQLRILISFPISSDTANQAQVPYSPIVDVSRRCHKLAPSVRVAEGWRDRG